MNLKGSAAILLLGCAFLSTRAKTVWGVATLLRRTRVKESCFSSFAILQKRFSAFLTFLSYSHV